MPQQVPDACKWYQRRYQNGIKKVCQSVLKGAVDDAK